MEKQSIISKINEFLIAHKDVNPEMFDDVCKEFLSCQVQAKKDKEEKQQHILVW